MVRDDGNPHVQARFPRNLKDEVDEYAERNQISKSEALRELTRAGLEAKHAEPSPWEERFYIGGTASAVIGGLSIALVLGLESLLTQPPDTGLLAILGLVGVVVGAVLILAHHIVKRINRQDSPMESI